MIDEAVERIDDELDAACARHDTEFEVDRLSYTEPIEFPEPMRRTVERAAEECSVSSMRMVSGAGHDAQLMHSFARTGMIFVPSVDGKTHVEAEFTEWDGCLAGAKVYANTTLDLATE